jgi:hypothetical protein
MIKRPVRRPLSPPLARVALLTLLLAGCGRCSPRPTGAPPERWVPADASGALVVAELGEVQRQASALYATLLALPGGGDLSLLRTGLGAQLGFDPFEPAALESVGIDPRRGLAVAELTPGAGLEPGQPGQPLIVLPVADEAKLRALVARLARDRLGAGEQGLENANGKAIDVWRRAAGEPALVALAVIEGTALLSAGASGPAAVRAALAVEPALSLAQSPGWQRARAAVGQGLPALFYLPAGAPPLQGGPFPDGAVVGVSAGARSLQVVLAGLLGAQESRLRPLAGPGPGRAGPSALDPDTVLAVRLSASPAALLDLLPGDPLDGRVPGLRDLAGLVEPGLDLGISLSPRADLAGAIASRGAIDPFQVVRFEVAGTVKDPAACAARFDALARELGGEAKPGRWRLGDGPIQVTWALSGSALAVAGGPAGGLEPLLARVEKRQPGLSPPARAAEALAGGLFGAVLSGDALAKGLKALPPEAFGTGPDAVVARSLAEKLAASAGQGGVLTLRADLPAGALRLALEATLGQPATSK